MRTDQDLEPLLSGYLDGELTQQQRQWVEHGLAGSAELRAKLDELTALREGISGLPTPEPTEAQRAKMLSALAPRTSRTAGWIFGILGLGVLVAYAIYTFARDPGVPALMRVAVLAVVLGGGLLFLSVLLERLDSRKTDRYRDVDL